MYLGLSSFLCLSSSSFVFRYLSFLGLPCSSQTCAHLCICTFAYRYLSVYLSIYLSFLLSLCVSIYIYLYPHMSMYISFRFSVSSYFCLCLAFLSSSLFLHVSVHPSIPVYIYLPKCVYLSFFLLFYLFIRLSISTYVYFFRLSIKTHQHLFIFPIFLSVSNYVCLCPSVFTYICVFICVRPTCIYLYISLFIYVYLFLAVCIYLCLPASIYIYLSIDLYLCLSLPLSPYLPLYLSRSLSFIFFRYWYIFNICFNILFKTITLSGNKIVHFRFVTSWVSKLSSDPTPRRSWDVAFFSGGLDFFESCRWS